MSLVRYGDNVFELDDVYGLELYTSDDESNVRVVLDEGHSSFKIRFDSALEAERAFEAICDELEVRDITRDERSEGPDTAAAE